MSDVDELRRLLVSILRSGNCQDIAFKNGGVTIMGYGYGYVATLIESGQAKVAIGNTGNFTAKYDSLANTMTFRSDALNKARTSSEGRGTLVHEATHAVIDAVAPGKRVRYIDDEVSAYLAETIYRLNCKAPVQEVGPVAGPLFKLATKIRNYTSSSQATDKGVYECTASDIDELSRQILSFYRALAKAEGKQLPEFSDPNGIPYWPPPPMQPDP